MKKIIYVSLLLFGMAMQAQTVQWLKTPVTTIPFNTENTGYTATCDASGNVYFTGYKANAIPLNDIVGDVLYNKYNADGELLFSNTIGGEAVVHKVTTDADGNVVMAIAYSHSLTIGTTVALTDVNSSMKYVIAKFDANGNLLWHKQLYMDGFDLGIVEDFRAIATDAEGNIYAGYDNYFYSRIAKYSPDGTKLLTIEQEFVNRMCSVAIDTEGNIYAAGGCAGLQSKYAGVLKPTEFQYNDYVVKYSPSGEYQWIKYVEDVTCPTIIVQARTPDEIYLSTYLNADFAFDDIEVTGPETGTDFFIARLNAAGEFQWVQEVPVSGNIGLGTRNYLSLDNAGNIFLAGSTRGTTNWGNGVATDIDGFASDALLLKYSPNGELLLVKTLGGTSEDRLDGVAVNNAGAIFISGVGNGSGTFDSFEYEGEQWVSYPFFAKIAAGTLGTNNPEAKTAMLYPNPASEYVIVSGIADNMQGQIVDILGQKIKTFKTSDSGAINVQELAKGTYFIKIEGLKALKFIKQ
jgi:hypothetical protein